MLGLGLQINKNLGGAGGRPPFYSDLSFYSRERIDEFVKNKLDATGDSDAYLTFDPTIDIIDLSKYDYTVVDGWNTVTFKTIEGDKVYRVISTFDTIEGIKGFTSVDDERSDNYIMDKNIDCSQAQTMKPVSKTDLLDWVSGTPYESLDKVLVGDDIYIKTPYMTGYDNTLSPELDTEEKYWHIYNYEGFWINTFSGVFNGNGFELQNCYVNKTSDYAGVFSQLSDTTLSNIGINGEVIGYSDYVGGLVGHNRSSSTITNSYSTNCTVTGNRFVGGLVGYNHSASTITNSYSTNCTVTGNDHVGGLVGYNYSASSTNSYSTNCTVTGNDHVGGLVGRIWSSSTITNCYYIGRRPSATNTIYLSLFCGRVGSSTITNSYACEIDDEGNDVSSPLRFANTTIGVTGSGNKTITDMKTKATYIDWDFTNIWGIDSNNDGYPYLRNLEGEYVSPFGTLTKIVVTTITIDENKYVVFPVIPGAGELSIFDRDNPTLYTDDARNSLDYLGAGYGLYWRIDKLNTANILSWMQPDYKFSWFVKNTFTEGTLDPITIKEIMAYNAPITGADNLSKMMKYLNLPAEVV